MLDVNFGSAGDDNLEPRDLRSSIGQELQDTRTTSSISTLIKCINNKNESVIRVVREVAEKVKEKRAIHRLWSEVRVVTQTLCYKCSKRGDDHGEFVDESRKDVDGFAQIRVVSPAEKGSSKVVSLMKLFANRMGQ